MRYLVIALVCCAVACGGTEPPPDEDVNCDEITTDDDFVIGANKLGENALLRFTLMAANPAPPSREVDNTWVFQVDSNATPVAGAMMRVKAYMPAHDHEAGKAIFVEPETTAGHYELAPIDLFMPGLWEVTLTVTSPDEDEVLFTFCVPK